MRNTPRFAVVIIVIAVLAAACAPGPNSAEKTPGKDGEIAGFWKGLWHGLIAPVTFIVSLFSKNTDFYEIHNSGGWYNFGFVLGAGLFLSGGIFGKSKTKRRDR